MPDSAIRERTLGSDHQKWGGATRSRTSEKYPERALFRYFAESGPRVLGHDSAGPFRRLHSPPQGNAPRRAVAPAELFQIGRDTPPHLLEPASVASKIWTDRRSSCKMTGSCLFTNTLVLSAGRGSSASSTQEERRTSSARSAGRPTSGSSSRDSASAAAPAGSRLPLRAVRAARPAHAAPVIDPGTRSRGPGPPSRGLDLARPLTV